jgi:type I restriction enzyme, S subunit
MTPHLLLSQFHLVNDAPGAIPRLRRFILELAVRGRLVPQNPSEEPAFELLKRIHLERTRWIKEGKTRPIKPMLADGIEDPPFVLPCGWAWSRFGQIADFSAGRTPPRHDSSFWNTGEYHWVSIADMKDGEEVVATKETISEKAKKQIFGSDPVSAGTLIMSFKLTIGKISRLGVPAFHNEAIIAIRPFVTSIEPYLFKVLPQFAREGDTKDALKGATLNRESIANILVPIPPLHEQDRIITKINELMAVCDQLEETQREEEKRRESVTKSSLFHFCHAESVEDIRANGRFCLDHIDMLTLHPEQIPAMRETVLNLAVRGQLVAQSADDETVAALLERLRAEQQRLIRAGLIPDRKQKRTNGAEALTFETPPGWKKVCFGELCNVVTSGSRGWAEYYSKSGPKFIRAQNIRFGKLLLDDLACVNPPKNGEGTRTQVSQGDLLVVITGAGVTNPALLDRELGEAYVSQHVALIKPTDTKLSPWLLLCLMAPLGGRAELVERAYGAGKPGLNLDNIRSLPIPLPPLAEQDRIVFKANALLNLCDELEEYLTGIQQEKADLLESLLHNSLAQFDLKDTGTPPVSTPGSVRVVSLN